MGYVADTRSTPFALFVGGVACILVAAVLAAFPRLIKGAVSQDRQVPFEPSL